MRLINIFADAFKKNTKYCVWFGVSAIATVMLCTSIIALLPAFSAWLAYKRLNNIEVDE